jgi:hypothetical protein
MTRELFPTTPDSPTCHLTFLTTKTDDNDGAQSRAARTPEHDCGPLTHFKPHFTDGRGAKCWKASVDQHLLLVGHSLPSAVNCRLVDRAPALHAIYALSLSLGAECAQNSTYLHTSVGIPVDGIHGIGVRLNGRLWMHSNIKTDANGHTPKLKRTQRGTRNQETNVIAHNTPRAHTTSAICREALASNVRACNSGRKQAVQRNCYWQGLNQ